VAVSAAKVHSLTGVLPLATFAIFHCWEANVAIGGRRAYVEAVSFGAGRFVVLGLLVLAPLVVHAGLGLHRARIEGGAGGYGSVGNRRLQLVSGVLVLAFVAVHLSHSTFAAWSGAGPAAIYDELRSTLSRPVYLGIYVAGLAAFALHLGQGLLAFAATWSFPRSPTLRRLFQVGSLALAIAVFVVGTNSLSHFASGRAVFWEAAAEEEAP